MTAGASEHDKPCGVDELADRATFPVKPPILVKLMDELPATFDSTVTETGFAFMLKSTVATVTVIETVWLRVPLAPVTLTL